MSKLNALKPLEWYIYGQGYLLVAWLYIQIVISPMGIFAIFTFFTLDIFGLEKFFPALYYSLSGGFVVGILWAERIRRTIGILTFHAYLLSTPEIEGWRNRNGSVIR
ncbi:hypothetical protein L2755_11855 [Shewanella abyssi]|uniref:hypothetical protein n=1 Tax=Shewanella abyssi TaxID=311789 RepID=UPI0020105E51|nr:hypothetical protein [Shewanella abyssi]MCL1050319.1 hypothetical protein [Shewanella abyssi]